MKSSLQFKIGLSYLSIIVIVLAILNTYPLIESQNLVFRSKESTVSSCVKVMESALSGLSGLTEGNVEKALGYAGRVLSMPVNGRNAAMCELHERAEKYVQDHESNH